ncbi:DNA polymerase [uncultured Selenomonas sp.]|uniref:DNA polymerase n=1 Tax=uncultured Selenomonas sp. TaxID=159275 RepID=UPI0025D226B5|nr:DNA polymerase [uncultured Selenomonas sp.]
MKKLSIDIETYSDVDLTKTGVYRYVESPAFEILLFGVSVDGGPVRVYDLACGECLPDEIVNALVNDTVLKWAYNASFERICISRWIRKAHPAAFRHYAPLGDAVGDYLNPASWRCSRIWGATLGLPLSLKGIGAVLNLDEQKMTEGAALIRYFCMPCKPTKANGMRTRNLPWQSQEKWALFKTYNQRDVEVEQAIQQKLAKFPVPDAIWKEYALDQQINDRGIQIDRTLVKQAIALDERARAALMGRMKSITHLENPNSVAQMKEWLAAQNAPMESLGKKEVEQAILTAKEPVKTILGLRLQAAKSSVKKYQAMAAAVCADGRARGMFQFYGATRTGRWSGRIIQLQNLRRNSLPDLAEARALVRDGNFDALELLYDSVPEVLSQLVRTAFVPRHGCKFIVADFSAIEARVLSYLAGESWRMKVFAENGDIYCAAAFRMFGVPVVKHGVNGELRQKGKIAELALGYGGSVGALKAMGALDMGLQESELQPLVDAWREANPNIVAFWWAVDRAVKQAVKERLTSSLGSLRFAYRSGFLFITLPSGRKLAYAKPQMGTNRFGGESVTYEGIGLTKKWERLESYGPKFVENIVQATSRDILMCAMQTLRREWICAHVHDELIIECEKTASVADICEKMGRTPPWMPGLLLRADGYECPFYQKD